jgi:hypothetical protein
MPGTVTSVWFAQVREDVECLRRNVIRSLSGPLSGFARGHSRVP